MRLTRTLIILLAALTGCSGPIITQESSPFTKIDGFYDYGAGGRDLRLMVVGNPFPMPDDVFGRVVEADLQVPLVRQPTHPTLTPDASAQPNYALILLFSPALALSGDDLCRGRFEHGAFGGNGEDSVNVRVLGAFCVSGRAVTEGVGQTQADRAGDQRFVVLMRQMMLTLFRPDIRDFGGGGGITP